MPSRSSHGSRSRKTSKHHKKSHKRSRKSSNERSLSTSNNSTKKKEKITNEKDNHSFYNLCLPSVILPPSFLATLTTKEEETVKISTEDQSTADSITSNIQITKKRKSRWIDDETKKVLLPNMPTTISATSMTEEQQKIYLLKLQIDELTRRLKMSDFGISSNFANRSPSPEPIYDQQGKRQNTREVRARRKIEEQRHQLVTELLALNPDYKPPGDYRPQQIKYIDKVMLPQEDYSDVNFIGLIIGPRGHTLKMLEKETNAKITIRGKGSLKDGKMGLIKNFPLPGEDEPLHAYITGTSVEIVAKAVEKIQELINQIIDTPDGLNEFRKQQLRQLALLNGTLRENDCLIKLKLINEAEKIVTNTIFCAVCGGAGHISSDCKFRKKPDGTYAELNPDGSLMSQGNRQEQQKLDCEYQSLMNELTGKKDTNTNILSLDDQRNLMNGSKTMGPTLAIANGSSSASSSSITNSREPVKTVGTVSFNSNGTMNIDKNYQLPSLMSLQTNTNSDLSKKQSSYSNTSFSSIGPRYNNNDVFDGYHLLRRTNQNNNYSSYIEGDPYRAQHIPALIENERNYNSSTSWLNSQQQNYRNQQWNQYNTPMYNQNPYQQLYYQNNNIGFTPPLPKEPPPPLPPY